MFVLASQLLLPRVVNSLLDKVGFVKLSVEGAEKSIERHDRIDGQSKIARMPDGCPRILGCDLAEIFVRLHSQSWGLYRGRTPTVRVGRSKFNSDCKTWLP